MKSQHPDCYLIGAGLAAAINFPLWKAAAISQSGFTLQQGATQTMVAGGTATAAGSGSLLSLLPPLLRPPYRGVPAVLLGMTWARASIFYGSKHGKNALKLAGYPTALATLLPPMGLSTIVQFVNMPLVRASITMQNPKLYSDPNYRSTTAAMRYIVKTKGIGGLWHGLSAGIFKTVPKYVSAVVVKDLVEHFLPPLDSDSHTLYLLRSAFKAVVAGLAGAILTNPMDVIRNEMFKTDLSFTNTVKKLRSEPQWYTRGLARNLTAVAFPITLTIFITDWLIRTKTTRFAEDED